MFLVLRLPAWRPGLGPGEQPASKAHINDSGLLAHLLGVSPDQIHSDEQAVSRILENFVVMEIIKQLPFSAVTAQAYHYRTDRQAVDLILESTTGNIVAIEVKTAIPPSASDWRSLAKIRDATRSRFLCGVVFYPGQRTISISDRLWAVPIRAMGSITAEPC
jgi:predicted AAA+ superfamily ATPase